MRNPYRYCTRCGQELSEAMQRFYLENHDGGPVLCLGCIQDALGDIAQSVNEIIKNGIEAMHKAFAGPLAAQEDDDGA